MKKSTWFTRTTGSVVRLAFSDCECKSYGRSHCFGCVIDPNYEEQPPRLSDRTVKPVWWKRRQETHFTPADLRFLAGIPERKPFYRKPVRRTWQRQW
jgi:hypothetical protein